MNKFKETLMKDFGWKLLSLLIAICLWFIVINTENPTETRTFTTTLQIKNESVIADRGQVISNYAEIAGQKITLKIRGQRVALDKLYKSRNEIQTHIDLAALEENSGNGEAVALNVLVKLPAHLSDAYQIESRSPNSINLVIEELVTQEKPIALDIEGSADASYTIATPEITPQTVTVTGTKSAVDSVDSVRAQVLVENIKEDSSFTAKLVPYNANKEQVTGVTLSLSQVQVYIPVKLSKKITLTSQYYGVPKAGFSVGEITIDPPSVYVLGKDTLLNELEQIELPPSNLDGRDSDFSMSYALKYLMPEGVKLTDDEQETKATVTIKIVPETQKEVTLNADRISFLVELPDDLIAEFAPGDIVFTVKGSEEDLAALSTAELTGSVSVVDLPEGTYSLPIVIELPEGVTLANEEETFVSITVAKPGTVPTDSTTP